MNHSPTPWKIEHADGELNMKDAVGESLMCNTQYYPWCPDRPEDWEFICRAVNNHANLLNVLKGVLREMVQQGSYDNAAYDLANEAIEYAEGETE